MANQRSNIESVLTELTQQLDAKVRGSVLRRHDTMLRELTFLESKQDEKLAYIRSRDWHDSKLNVLFCLNSLYQEVLGPLDASARTGRSMDTTINGKLSAGLGSNHPIVHGSQRFDSAHTARVKNAIEDFFNLVFNLGFRREWMTKNTCGDLVYWVARYEQEKNPDSKGKS